MFDIKKKNAKVSHHSSRLGYYFANCRTELLNFVARARWASSTLGGQGQCVWHNVSTATTKTHCSAVAMLLNNI